MSFYLELDADRLVPIANASCGLFAPALGQDLLDRVRNAPPDFFERLIVNLHLSMGYGGSRADKAGRTLGSGDDGVDGVIDQDALGAWIVCISKPNATPPGTTSVPARFEISSAASIVIKRAKGCS
jgi:restriction endonuclease Mrr